MNVKFFEQEGVAVFQVTGEINISTSPELKKLFEKDPKKKIVIDFENVTYLDSSGLATLVEVLKKTKNQGGALGLSNMPGKIKSLFEITKLDKLFSIFQSQADAVSQVK